jgi:hypothetical protein
VAPQSPIRLAFSVAVSPFFFGAGTRQGPIAQFLQQLPSAPIGQGFMASARSKIVSHPSAWAFFNIFIVAGSILFFSKSDIYSSFNSPPSNLLMVSQKISICHPELVSGSHKSLILLDAESSSA